MVRYMETIVTIIHVLSAVFMILVIIIQGGNSGGVGAAFGGGNSQGVFGATGAQNFLGKLTYMVAAVFMLTSIGLSVIQGQSGKTGLTDRLEQAAESATSDEAAPTTESTSTPTGDEAAKTEEAAPQK